MAGPDDLPKDWWTIGNVASYLGVTASTVRTYVARGDMPPPDRRYERTPLWKPKTITEWHASRPRKGQAQ